MVAETTDVSRERRLRAVVALPLVALGLVVPFTGTAQQTRRLSAAPFFSVSVDSLVTTVALTLCLVLPLLWVGVRTLSGGGSTRGQVGAYLYALGAYLVAWPLGGSFGGLLFSFVVGTGGAPTHVEWSVGVLHPFLVTSVLLVGGLLVGIPASRRLARLDAATRERHPSARTSGSGVSGGVGDTGPTDDDTSSPPMPERRALLGVTGAVGVSLLGGVGVGRELSVEYDSASYPQVAFDFEYDSNAGEVTVTHAGGDSVTQDHPGRLAVTVNGASERRWSRPVVAGDTTTVGAAPGDTVRVVWEWGTESLVIGAYDVPRE